VVTLTDDASIKSIRPAADVRIFCGVRAVLDEWVCRQSNKLHPGQCCLGSNVVYPDVVAALSGDEEQQRRGEKHLTHRTIRVVS